LAAAEEGFDFLLIIVVYPAQRIGHPRMNNLAKGPVMKLGVIWVHGFRIRRYQGMEASTPCSDLPRSVSNA